MAKEDFLKRQIEGIMKVYAKLLHREQKKETEKEKIQDRREILLNFYFQKRHQKNLPVHRKQM